MHRDKNWWEVNAAQAVAFFVWVQSSACKSRPLKITKEQAETFAKDDLKDGTLKAYFDGSSIFIGAM